jgi:hypothetical protein
MDRRLLRMLEGQPHLIRRIEALQQIAGVGPVTALTWARPSVASPIEHMPSLRKAKEGISVTA